MVEFILDYCGLTIQILNYPPDASDDRKRRQRAMELFDEYQIPIHIKKEIFKTTMRMTTEQGINVRIESLSPSYSIVNQQDDFDLLERRWEENGKTKVDYVVVLGGFTGKVDGRSFGEERGAFRFNRREDGLEFILSQLRYPITRRGGVGPRMVKKAPQGRRLYKVQGEIDEILLTMACKKGNVPNCEVKNGYVKTLCELPAGENIFVKFD